MKKCLLITCLLISSIASYGQDTATIEKDLFKYYTKLEQCAARNVDSAPIADSAFEAKLMYYISKVPATLKQSFSSLRQKGFTVSTSSDGLFRIYNWDNETGGTMRFFDNAFQFKSGNKVVSGTLPYCYQAEDGDPGCWYSYTIYTLKGNYKTYYVALYGSIGSSRVSSRGVKFFTIDNGRLNDTVHLVKTKSGLAKSIDYVLDNNSPGSQHSVGDGAILYDIKTTTLYIPIIWEDGTVTKDYIKYRFNGSYFEKVKN